ncbi:DUF5709 domain-containing protein [Actinomycetospora flava]|uniref:DUF5709 domain-containing protein n=1 Tax=Actinomycetospora flava TaxID=3129232 RepID=A0ABU8M3V8_9PSEU
MTTPETPDSLGGDDPDTVDDTSLEQLDEAESLDNPDLDDPLDEGVSPNEQPWGTTAWGTTQEEEEEGEPLADRLRRERSDPDDDEDGDGLGDASDTDGELWDDEVGEARSGRLVLREDGEDFFADDVGVDGAGASAEEAAIHLVDEDR